VSDALDRMHDARILVVDDNPANVLLLERILDGAGYTNVTSTTDPCVVSGLHTKWHFDLILLDIRMPGMTGLEVMEQMAETIKNEYLPILVLTSETDDDTRMAALDLGAKDFVTKPFKKPEVLHRIRNMLEVRLLYNRERWSKEIVEAQVRERTQQLYDTQLDIIRRLAAAGEYRDNETGMHVVRMSKSCQRLAAEAGLDAKACELILHASPMHDVGKIGIPDRILLKPGKLGGEEWEIMKSHATIGADILGSHTSEVMQMARAIALSHHEKWDGSGYPYGLQGDAIPIGGRIAALCDVFDALTSERPYKKAWPVNEAIDFISQQAGQHFDPVLVGHFEAILPDIINIRDAHADTDEQDNQSEPDEANADAEPEAVSG